MHYGNRGGALTDDGKSAFEAAFARGLKVDIDYVEQRLSENGGKSLQKEGFGVADIMNSFPLLMAQNLFGSRSETWRKNTGLELGQNTKAWLETLQNDQHYKKASQVELDDASEDVKKSGDYLTGLFGVKK